MNPENSSAQPEKEDSGTPSSTPSSDAVRKLEPADRPPVLIWLADFGLWVSRFLAMLTAQPSDADRLKACEQPASEFAGAIRAGPVKLLQVAIGIEVAVFYKYYLADTDEGGEPKFTKPKQYAAAVLARNDLSAHSSQISRNRRVGQLALAAHAKGLRQPKSAESYVRLLPQGPEGALLAWETLLNEAGGKLPSLAAIDYYVETHPTPRAVKARELALQKAAKKQEAEKLAEEKGKAEVQAAEKSAGEIAKVKVACQTVLAFLKNDAPDVPSACPNWRHWLRRSREQRSRRRPNPSPRLRPLGLSPAMTTVRRHLPRR